jgi:hypothetical protein
LGAVLDRVVAMVVVFGWGSIYIFDGNDFKLGALMSK